MFSQEIAAKAFRSQHEKGQKSLHKHRHGHSSKRHKGKDNYINLIPKQMDAIERKLLRSCSKYWKEEQYTTKHERRRNWSTIRDTTSNHSSSSDELSQVSQWSTMNDSATLEVPNIFDDVSTITLDQSFDEDRASEPNLKLGNSISISDVSISASDPEFTTLLEGGKVIPAFQCYSMDEAEKTEALYQSLFSLISSDAILCNIDLLSSESKPKKKAEFDYTSTLEIPALSFVYKIHKSQLNKDQESFIKTYFASKQWTFHHSENKPGSKSAMDYYSVGTESPLCAIQIEQEQIKDPPILQLVIFVSSNNWRDMLNLYSLLLGENPESLEPDSALFTTAVADHYKIQLIMKRTPTGILCRSLESVIFSFRISQPGHIVPLLPNICDQISETQWITSDFDGNILQLEVVRDDEGLSQLESASQLDVEECSDVYATASDIASEVFESMAYPLEKFTHRTKSNLNNSSHNSDKVPQIKSSVANVSCLNPSMKVQRPEELNEDESVSGEKAASLVSDNSTSEKWSSGSNSSSKKVTFSSKETIYKIEKIGEGPYIEASEDNLDKKGIYTSYLSPRTTEQLKNSGYLANKRSPNTNENPNSQISSSLRPSGSLSTSSKGQTKKISKEDLANTNHSVLNAASMDVANGTEQSKLGNNLLNSNIEFHTAQLSHSTPKNRTCISNNQNEDSGYVEGHSEIESSSLSNHDSDLDTITGDLSIFDRLSDTEVDDSEEDDVYKKLQSANTKQIITDKMNQQELIIRGLIRTHPVTIPKANIHDVRDNNGELMSFYV